MARNPIGGPTRRRPSSRRPTKTTTSSETNQNKWSNLYGNTWQGLDETADDPMIAGLVDAARNKETQNINNMIGRGQISSDIGKNLLSDLDSSLVNYQASLNSLGRTSLGNFNEDQRSYLGNTFNTGSTPNFTGASDYLGGASFANQKNDFINSTLNSSLKANPFDFSPNINNALMSNAGNVNTDPMFSAALANKSKKQNQAFSF